MSPRTTCSRLGSWKEIAAYLGRDVRTVIRWEKERGLPVYRDTSGPGRATVYADVEKLDDWLMGHPSEEGARPAGAEAPPVPPEPATIAHPHRSVRKIALFSLAVALLGGLVIIQPGLVRPANRHLQFSRIDFPAAAPMSIAIADFDGDGNPDIIFTNSGNDSLDILFGDGHGGFSRRTSIPSAREPERLMVADFNRDGNPDIAVTHRGSQDVTVLLGDGHGGFRESFRWAAGGRSRWVTAADLNGDGIPDLVIACSSAHRVAVMLGRGDGAFDRIRQYETVGEASAVMVGDFNHDNIPDLVVADYQVSGGKTISLYPGKGDGTFGSRRTFPTGPGPLALAGGDFNHDGLLDIATADFHDSVSVLLGRSDGFSPAQSFAARSAPGFIVTGDFDGDGHTDLLMVAEHSNDAHLYYGDGRGRFPTSQVFATAGYPDSVAAADLDRDGRLDFVVAATYGDLVSVYLNRTPR